MPETACKPHWPKPNPKNTNGFYDRFTVSPVTTASATALTAIPMMVHSPIATPCQNCQAIPQTKKMYTLEKTKSTNDASFKFSEAFG